MNKEQKSTTKKDDKPSTEHRKEVFLEAIVKTFGLITQACESSGISRTAYYTWIKDDPDYRERVRAALEESRETGLDFVEGKLLNLIKKEEPSAVFFYLKCKGKGRGFFEKSIHAIETPKDESPLTDEQKANIADMLDGGDDSGVSQ